MDTGTYYTNIGYSYPPSSSSFLRYMDTGTYIVHRDTPLHRVYVSLPNLVPK